MRELDLELYAKPYLDWKDYSGTDLKERVHVAGGTLVLESHVTSLSQDSMFGVTVSY